MLQVIKGRNTQFAAKAELNCQSQISPAVHSVPILVFFTLYKLLWRKEISEPRTATNFKVVLGSRVVGFGICGISGLWIMLAEQLPSLQKKR